MITGFRNIRDVAFVLGCGIRNARRGDSDLTFLSWTLPIAIMLVPNLGVTWAQNRY